MNTQGLDLVNHPPHYQSNGMEVIDVIEAFGLDRNLYRGNVVKYVLRAGKKGSEVQDLEKARWYLDREIARLKGETVKPAEKVVPTAPASIAIDVRDWYWDVMSFHVKLCPSRIGTEVALVESKVYEGMPTHVSWRLVKEEADELARAMNRRDFPEVVDGAIDLIYVLLGLLIACGVDPRPIWDAVHASNMAKEGGETRADGKVLKPPGWTAPDVAGLLRKQGWEG